MNSRDPLTNVVVDGSAGAAVAGIDSLEHVPCPLCGEQAHEPWGLENGFSCVRCARCSLLYVTPRPATAYIDRAVQLGVHASEQVDMNVVGRRAGWKVARFRRSLQGVMPGLSRAQSPVRWLDVGAGFGEFVEAVRSLAPAGSACEGIEPMVPKAQDAQRRGLPVRAAMMEDVTERYDVISLIDVFSHIPDFHAFLRDIKRLLGPNGELLLKTGNAADLPDRSHFPGPLTLPDHLLFGGERQIRRFLEQAGFQVITVRAERMDGVLYSLRNLVKWLLRRPVCLSWPYTSPARVLWIHARRSG